MKYLFCIILSAVIVVGGHATLCRSQDSAVGHITEVTGRATVSRSDGRETGAVKDLPLYPGDTITTSKDGVVGFVLNDGDSFRINQDSEVSLDELTASDEDNPPTLRLSLGFLWSKIRRYLSNRNREVIHTPTAVIGVRGTEFDTVVAEDSSSTVVVDEGTVAIEAEKEQLEVGRGQAAEVDPDEKIKPPTRAIPKEQRDWREFRRKRAELLVEKLPRNAPKIRKRFERDVNRYLRFSKKIHAHADRILAQVGLLHEAVQKRDRNAVRNQLHQIRMLEQQFRPMAIQYRRAFNRLRVIGKNTFHVTNFFEKNRDRFSPEDRAAIKPNLEIVSKKINQLRKASQETVAKIRQTYRELKQIGRMAEKSRSGESRKDGAGRGKRAK